MRTFHLASQVRHAVSIGFLMLVTAAPSAAAESASTVSFTNRDALTATDTRGWRNPLRPDGGAPSDANTDGNRLRQQVTPVSYEEDLDINSSDGAGPNSRAPRGLKLRPHMEPTGIFSGLMGGNGSSATKQRPTSSTARPPQFRPPQRKPQSSSAAAQQAISMMPQFKSGAARPISPTAGSNPATRSAMPAAYNTAASAQNYRPNNTVTWSAANAGQTLAKHSPHRDAPLARPTLNTARVPQLPSAKSASKRAASSAAGTSPVETLTQAHQIAETAHTEAEFSEIIALCKQVPAREATAEEAAFGRQLAAWALNRRGQIRARGGNSQAALADFDQAIHIDARCWRALHNRGVLLAQAGQFEPAFDDFHHTIELRPNFAKAYANRGALYVLAGETELGLADYQRAAALDPNFAIAERGCGRACHMLGRVNEALEHLSRAIEIAPQDASAYASRGDLLTDLGQYEAAAADYDQALVIKPDYADACRGSAWLLATCPDGAVRNPGVALERAEKAAQLDRKPKAATFDTLAAAQAATGDFRAAQATIGHAIELASPEERTAYQERLQLYRQAKPFRIEPSTAVQQANYSP